MAQQTILSEAREQAEQQVQRVLAEIEAAQKDIQDYNVWFRRMLTRLDFDLPKIRESLRKIGFEITKVVPRVHHRGKIGVDGMHPDYSKEGMIVEIWASMCGRRKPQPKESWILSKSEQKRRDEIRVKQEQQFLEETDYRLGINPYSLDKAEGCLVTLYLAQRK
jgi:hypothetical protein